MLFFLALLLRRQWIENEALAFPLLQLPLQMVEVGKHDIYPPCGAFWKNHTMWSGAGLAMTAHLLRGLNNFYPDWPVLTSFHGNTFGVYMPDQPWNVIGWIPGEIFLGAIGVAYLLTREVSLSFWLFYSVLGKYPAACCESGNTQCSKREAQLTPTANLPLTKKLHFILQIPAACGGDSLNVKTPMFSGRRNS